MDYRAEHHSDVMMDEDSRDSGVSVNSNDGHIDMTSSQFTLDNGNKYGVRINSVANGLDKDLFELKIEEMCIDLDESEWSTNELLMKKAAALNKLDNPRTPLSDIANKGQSLEVNEFGFEESPKSRRDGCEGFVRTAALQLATYRSKSLNDSSMINQMWSRQISSNEAERSDMEAVWCDELNVTMSDASSVFSDDTQSSASTSSTDAKHLFVRRTHSDGSTRTADERIGMRQLSNEERSWGCETPLGGVRVLRKRSYWEAKDAIEDVAAKKAKATDATTMIYGKETDNVVPRRSSGISRALSSGALERGQFAKLKEDELPKLLEVNYSLPTVPHPQVDSGAFRSISAETFIELLNKMGREEFASRFVVVDCRYPYEYDGGHVKGAVNIHDPDDVIQFFFPEDAQQFGDISQKIPIFYCEFSQKRGPTMAHALRAHDRKVNEMRYPDVFYKEIYLVDYGYRRFYQLSKLMGLCEPNAYVTMTDTCYVNELRSFHFHRSRSVHSIDQTLSRRSHLSRRFGKISFRCLKSAIGLSRLLSSPQDEESPTQFPNTNSSQQVEKVEEEVQLTPLSKLDFS